MKRASDGAYQRPTARRPHRGARRRPGLSRAVTEFVTRRGPGAEPDRAAHGTRTGACGRDCDRSRAVGGGRRHDCRRRHDSGHRSRWHRGPGSRGAVERTDSTMTKRLVVAYGGSLDGAAAVASLAAPARRRCGHAHARSRPGDGSGAGPRPGACRRRTPRARRRRPARAGRAGSAAGVDRGRLRRGPACHRRDAAGHRRRIWSRSLAWRAQPRWPMARSGADRVRFERLIADLAPELTVHALAEANRDGRRRRASTRTCGAAR